MNAVPSLLTPPQARDLLQRRHARLTQQIAELDAMLAVEVEHMRLPRVTMLETEYVRAVTAAELCWVATILDGLADQSIHWSLEGLSACAVGASSIPNV